MKFTRMKALLCREVKIVLITLISSSLVLFLLISQVAQAYRVEGKSMEPSLFPRERVIVSKITYKLSTIERGDIIIFHSPRQPRTHFVKRVIGLPGEIVFIKEGKVFINNHQLLEPYLNGYQGIKECIYPLKMPQDCYYVLGDHRSQSNDSRNGWLVPKNTIIGKVVFRYWPLKKAGKIQ